jgi:hypothetical protein
MILSRFRKICCVAVGLAFGASCGLPSSYYLAPPTALTLAAGGSTAAFESPGYSSGSDTEFVGFDVYYKFLSATPGSSDVNLGGGGTAGPGTLTSNGFLPICLSTDDPPSQRTIPSIAIPSVDRPDSFTVTLSINTTGASSCSYTDSVTGNSVAKGIGRHVAYTTTSISSKAFACNSFVSNDYTSSDSDVESIWSVASTQGYAYVALYVISYGYEAGTSNVQYSTSVYIGYVQITTFP